ncbi:MAG: excinuclease ABC subunit UvrB [Syntrophomonas sp.]|uniref:excinuclease ABC subunit UvrB n=1 Tax=Syntrophomonas sp. TaxID=2053627 RepID=UPI002605D376|nr:excinuclease ABC subunit UvrB [Syntrophomonas sp.]MDD2510210.1 excinuclease ABC subunit UvrB [Syntrophomonas sp.]MDD3879695.1 excinuclease ABC subunit UvrB [Syntrophomonas sp.]MDD4626489.1 excinuclease ABC subunit UvrB [Syntrophomonas sp.]
MPEFKLHSSYKATGDQPQAIKQLLQGVAAGFHDQTLLGVTGSGKTFTMARIIEELQRPALVMAPNKTLAGQLYSEFKQFFPENAVEYFISYYDYYQPEAYVPQTDTYIEKDSSINDEIDKLRHSATAAVLERRDVIIVASVSCIYGLGAPEDYYSLAVSLRPGMEIARDDLLRRLVDNHYERNDYSFFRGNFRARGDMVEIFPASSNEQALRVEFFGDEIERIIEFNPLSGEIIGGRLHSMIFPASHFVTSRERMLEAAGQIEEELAQQLARFKMEGKLLEAQRLEQRTRYDLEMIREIGYCKGIENYSRYITGRAPGEAPYTLLDFFPDDFLLFIDESHIGVPQIRGMYEGDRSRKQNLVDFGFRLPSALDNRPLKFAEFQEKVKQVIYVSATPANYELEQSRQVSEQIIRPTGLVDPEVEVRPTRNQIDDLMAEARAMVDKGFRVLVTTLTKRMAEDLSDYLADTGLKVRYMHSDIDALQRLEILRELRSGVFDVLVGINLLREGLDLPEVALVAILDADKEGFLRSARSLVQTIGRAARNVEGKVIMYADEITPSMKSAIDETNRRRLKQLEYNREHHITPESIRKDIHAPVEATIAEEAVEYDIRNFQKMAREERERLLREMESDMYQAAENLEFERAARLRDSIRELQQPVKKARRRGKR